MQLGRVVGHATATMKHPTLNGWKLLVVQLLTTDDGPDGEPVLVIDNLGAGAGAVVVVTTDGLMVRDMVGAKTSPTRFAVMGLADDR